MNKILILVPFFIAVLIGASMALPYGGAFEGIQADVEQPSQVETEPNGAAEVAPVQQAEAPQSQEQEPQAEAAPDSPAISELEKYAQAQAADDLQAVPIHQKENTAARETQAAAAAQEIKTSVFQLKQAHASQLNEAQTVQLKLAEVIRLNQAEAEQAVKAECKGVSEAECLKQVEEEYQKEALAAAAEVSNPEILQDKDLFVNIKLTGAPKIFQAAAQIKNTEAPQIFQEAPQTNQAEILHVTQAEAEHADVKRSYRYEDENPQCAKNCYPCYNDWKRCCCQQNRHYTPLNF